MITKFLKGFYINNENVFIEVWGKYNNDVITSYSVKIHQSAVDYTTSYETLEEVEKVYKKQIETFKNNNVKHFEEKEEIADRYNEILKEVEKQKNYRKRKVDYMKERYIEYIQFEESNIKHNEEILERYRKIVEILLKDVLKNSKEIDEKIKAMKVFQRDINRSYKLIEEYKRIVRR